MNREMLVARVIKEETNYVIGGYENSIQDGMMTEMPNKESLLAEIYAAVIASKGVQVGGGIMPVKKDIRFLGTARVKELIMERIEKKEL